MEVQIVSNQDAAEPSPSAAFGGSTSAPTLEDATPQRASRPGHRVVVVIPALNEQDTIGRVISQVPRTLAGVSRVEVILVDDGSNDLTTDRALAAGVDHVVRHSGNRGLAAAFNRGTTEALARGADIVVTLDADGQHDPSAMPLLVAPIVEGTADLVVAARPLDDPTQGSVVRRVGNRIGSAIAQRFLNVPLSDVTSGYRAFSREALMHVHVSTGFTYTLETLVQAASKRLRMTEVIVPAHRRLVGTSRMTHSILRYVGRTGNQAFRTSLHTNPLALFGRLAAAVAVAAVLMTAYFIAAYAVGGLHLPALLAAVLLAGCSAALLVCGLIADGICASRRLTEDILARVKRLEAGDAGAAAAPAHLASAAPSYLPARALVDVGEVIGE
jgi:glycosyltransferase involved in cell wall biosynthesis